MRSGSESHALRGSEARSESESGERGRCGPLRELCTMYAPPEPPDQITFPSLFLLAALGVRAPHPLHVRAPVTLSPHGRMDAPVSRRSRAASTATISAMSESGSLRGEVSLICGGGVVTHIRAGHTCCSRTARPRTCAARTRRRPCDSARMGRRTSPAARCKQPHYPPSPCPVHPLPSAVPHYPLVITPPW